MWKNAKWVLLIAIVFLIGKAYGRRQPVVMYKDCGQHLEEWKQSVREGWKK